MVSEDRWCELERREHRSERIRDRFGLTDRRSDPARDWLLGAGAIPFTLIVVALVVYVVIMIVVGP